MSKDRISFAMPYGLSAKHLQQSMDQLKGDRKKEKPMSQDEAEELLKKWRETRRKLRQGS